MRYLALVVSLLAVSPAAFADRYIWVNGKRMAPAEVAYLEQLRCGAIPDGRYWLDIGSGIWGYAGNPRPQGHISDNCYRGQAGGGGGSTAAVRRLHERRAVLVRERGAGRAVLTRRRG
jgi:hypothetical protein